MTSSDTLSPRLYAAIVAALAAYEADATPLRDLSSAPDSRWRVYGRRAQIASRFDGRHVIPSLPTIHLGWRRAPWGGAI